MPRIEQYGVQVANKQKVLLRLERLLNKPSSYLISVTPVAELIAFTYDKIPLL